MDALTGRNAYESRFNQGATIVPRNFFFVDINQALPEQNNVRDRVVALQTSAASDLEAKEPWKGQILSGRAEGNLLFRTAISRNIIPFALIDPLLVLLPVISEESAEGTEFFHVLTAEKLLEKGFSYGSRWFFEAEQRWDDNKTDVNRKQQVDLSSYLNWRNKLSDQSPRARFLVLYTSSATDASAVMIDRRAFDHPFVVDHKAYWCECESEGEAYYLTSYINSYYANEMIKEFQSRGLFGPRDIHKLIVKLPFPKFKKSEAKHKILAELGKKCAELAHNFVTRANPKELQARSLGRLRSKLRVQLETELDSIDELVEELSTGRSEAVRTAARRARRRNNTGGLFS